MDTTVLLVEDHDLVRFGLATLLQSSVFGAVRVLEAGSLAQALGLYAANETDISLVVLDLNLTDVKGLAALTGFKARYPQARIVVLSGSVDDAIMDEALALGAERFLHKSNDVDRLAQELRDCMTRSQDAIDVSTQIGSHRSKRLNLSQRELEILDLVLQGCSNQEIVDATGLKIGTIKNYISGLLVVFGVTSRSKLVSLFH
jgi:DNA-binding NarL/FixJ family response regulator